MSLTICFPRFMYKRLTIVNMKYNNQSWLKRLKLNLLLLKHLVKLTSPNIVYILNIVGFRFWLWISVLKVGRKVSLNPRVVFTESPTKSPPPPSPTTRRRDRVQVKLVVLSEDGQKKRCESVFYSKLLYQGRWPKSILEFRGGFFYG